MSFTDTDLKWLKEDVAFHGNSHTLLTIQWQMLIARLEASERKNRALELHHDADNDGDCFKGCPSCKEMKDSDEAYRKAAGKSGG